MLKEPYGVFLWEPIRRGWGGFHDMLSLGWVMDSVCFCLSYGVESGDTILEDASLMLYYMVRNKEVFVADNMNWNSGVLSLGYFVY